VENPAFAHFCSLSLTIFHVSHAQPYPVSHPQPVHSLAQGNGLFCNEQHYEASIYVERCIYVCIYLIDLMHFLGCSTVTVPAHKLFKQDAEICHFIQESELKLEL